MNSVEFLCKLSDLGLNIPKMANSSMSYLVCVSCGYEQDLPEHHGTTMGVQKSGSGEPEKLTCAVCGDAISVPMHCGQLMKLVD